MIIKTLQEAELQLQDFVPLVAQLTGKDTTLKRIQPLMQLLNNPQEQLKVVHIAGTSGKTSTAYFMASILRATGLTVGLTVSPHIDSVLERVQVNGSTISEQAFCEKLGEFLDYVEQAPSKPSYFELLYAFSIWYFAQIKVDYAVVETGMGGLYDATNVVTNRDKICVITDIGYDHMHILGNTLEEITTQKLGITHPGNIVFMFDQAPTIMKVAADEVKKRAGAELHVLDFSSVQKKYGELSPSMPDYQQRNWLLASSVYDYIVTRDGLPKLTTSQLAKTQEVRVPGRFTVLHQKNHTIVMDGAHNAQKMATFIASYKKIYGDQKPAVLVAMKADKQYSEVIRLLKDFASSIIVTTFQTTQDLPAKAVNPKQILEALQNEGFKNTAMYENSEEAYRQLLASPTEALVVTGSFYLLAELRRGIAQ